MSAAECRPYAFVRITHDVNTLNMSVRFPLQGGDVRLSAQEDGRSRRAVHRGTRIRDRNPFSHLGSRGARGITCGRRYARGRRAGRYLRDPRGVRIPAPTGVTAGTGRTGAGMARPVGGPGHAPAPEARHTRRTSRRASARPSASTSETAVEVSVATPPSQRNGCAVSRRHGGVICRPAGCRGRPLELQATER
jgi:hypothetical protein